MKKNERVRVKELEVGKDYIDRYGSGILIIDRKGDINNYYFYCDEFKWTGTCQGRYRWREASESEVIEAFRKHLVYRYGKDWETIKIKEKHPSSCFDINDGLWDVEISKEDYGWNVWNKNGLLYCEGVWVERLEEEEINIKASDTQIGGSHYSGMAIQPTEFIHKNNLSFIQGNVIKYVCRYKSKGGVQDLNKAKHYIDLLIELEEE